MIADTFPPLRTSGAVQMRDLALAFVRDGHSVTVILPIENTKQSWLVENNEDVRILRLCVPKTKGVGYIRRALGELLMPFYMRRNFTKSPLAAERWESVIWYAPSIFHGPFVNFLKKASGCKSYLIIRDIFPEWAVDIGLMRRNLPYYFFRAVARYQYSVADVIGVQSQGNLQYFADWKRKPGRTLEVLQNWLGRPDSRPCSIQINETILAERKIFVYAGNMGVAQSLDRLLELAQTMLSNTQVGFLFVGRGSEFLRLECDAQDLGLVNTLFFDEIHPDEIPTLYSQCDVGIVSLDARHKSHNIPGKFLTYMQAGLPVLANVNPGNDLASIVRHENVGRVCESNEIEELSILCLDLLMEVDADAFLAERCVNLFIREYAVKDKVKQISQSLQF
ncbi:glycosyltransferase family 4 protein [Granulosicoccus sp.]|nr:glycosyltransferase family 4 protein [Granulosicoccus sp.]MDB4224518.1 glycosyltransferase family 4 protein [Granulosicoccus sp.]